MYVYIPVFGTHEEVDVVGIRDCRKGGERIVRRGTIYVCPLNIYTQTCVYIYTFTSV